MTFTALLSLLMPDFSNVIWQMAFWSAVVIYLLMYDHCQGGNAAVRRRDGPEINQIEEDHVIKGDGRISPVFLDDDFPDDDFPEETPKADLTSI